MAKKEIQIVTTYLTDVYQPTRYKQKIDLAIKKLKNFKRKVKFDAIAFTGHSGAAFAYPLSYALKIPLMCIRKDPKDSHYYQKFEGFAASQKYLIVDDGMVTGNTIKTIIKEINNYYNNHVKQPQPECVGLLFYHAAIVDSVVTIYEAKTYPWINE